MTSRLRLCVKNIVAGFILTASAASAFAAEVELSPVVVPQARQFDLTAKSGRDYRIFLAIPDGEAPEKGWPIVYVTDGNLNFLPVVAAAQKQSRGGLATVVVGIGYPSDDRKVHYERRSWDLTPATSFEWQKRFAKGMAISKTGGQDEFLSFINDELKPTIDELTVIDPSRQALFGHSLGGLFVLHALFNRPESFQYYFAASPSLWWNNRSILQEADHFLKTRGQPLAHTTLLISVGELEDVPDPSEPSERNRIILERKMVTSAKDLCERIDAAEISGFNVNCRVFAGDHHGSVVISAANASLRALMSQATSQR